MRQCLSGIAALSSAMYTDYQSGEAVIREAMPTGARSSESAAQTAKPFIHTTQTKAK